jgi:hypothetical protein
MRRFDGSFSALGVSKRGPSVVGCIINTCCVYRKRHPY